MAAAESLNLPKAAKLSYLKKACDFQWNPKSGKQARTPIRLRRCWSVLPTNLPASERSLQIPYTGAVGGEFKPLRLGMGSQAGQENLDRRRAATK